MELDFSHRESDITIGANEDFGQRELDDGNGSRLSAHLTPRSKLDVSWTDRGESGAQNAPLLTAQGEIAIDVDAFSIQSRASWAIQCVRGTTRTLELRIDDQDEVTELQLDDRTAPAGVERDCAAGKLTVRLEDSLRRRGEAAGHENAAHVFERRHAAHFIRGISSDPRSRAVGIHRHHTELELMGRPRHLARAAAHRHHEATDRTARRPSTRLAFEFLDQPFLLELLIEPSPPLVRAESNTVFQIDQDQAQSETSLSSSGFTAGLSRWSSRWRPV